MGCLDSPVQGVELVRLGRPSHGGRPRHRRGEKVTGRKGRWDLCIFFYMRRVLPVTPLGLGEIYHSAPGNLLAL